MLCGFYLITHSVVTNNVKTEKDFKSDSLYIGFEFEARCHLAQPSLYLIICTGSREPKEMPFSWLFQWDVEGKEKSLNYVSCHLLQRCSLKYLGLLV